MDPSNWNQLHPWRLFLAAVLVIALADLSGCGDAGNVSAPSGPSSAGGGATAARKVKFKDGAGNAAFSIKFMADGGKLVDASENEMARFKLKDDKLKIKDPEEKVLAYVTGDADKLKIKDATQATALFILQRQADGDYKLEDGAEKLLIMIKKKEYGYRLEDPAEKELFKVKVKDGKTSLRDAGDQTRYYTKDPIHPAAVACLGLEALTLQQRTGLMFRVNMMAAPWVAD